MRYADTGKTVFVNGVVVGNTYGAFTGMVKAYINVGFTLNEACEQAEIDWNRTIL